jgi:membrane protein YdbS with pleckstrin-like domain
MLEICVLAAVVMSVVLFDLGAIRQWLIAIIVAVGAVYILGGLALYPRAKSHARSFAVRMFDDGLAIAGDKESTTVPYRDLTIDRVESGPQGVSEIRLRTAFGQRIVLRDLERLDELYAELQTRLAKND